MKYIVGNSIVNLSQKEFLTQGGQGNIYVKDNTVYKIYIDPSKMIPVSKIHDLSVLTNTNIIKPEELIIDSSTRNPVGFTMPFVDDTYILCQLFPRAFRDRNKVTNDRVANLVKSLKEMVDFAHSKDILIVDLNEMNFLLSKNLKQIYAIDVDNWQTKSHPCLAIMENVRDPHSKDFTKLTDWYSYAITSFQMWVGIHPFRGTYSAIKKWQDRMVKNISVFHKDVIIPASALPFDMIPQVYRDWYKAVFEDAKRIPPPDSFIATTVVPKFATETVSNKVNLTLFTSLQEQIQALIEVGNTNVIVGENFFFIGKRSYTKGKHSAPFLFGNKLIQASISSGKLALYNKTDDTPVLCDYLADSLMIYDNRLYIKSVDSIIEVSLFDGRNLRAIGKQVANILPRSSVLAKGVLIQNLLGSIYCSFFPNSGLSYQIKIPELDDYKIIHAVYSNQILIVLGMNRKTNQYDKLVFRFDLLFREYDCRTLFDVDNAEVEFIVLDTGIAVHLLEDGKVELFKNLLKNSVIRILEDPVFNSVGLAKNGNNLLLIKGNEIYIAKMQ